MGNIFFLNARFKNKLSLLFIKVFSILFFLSSCNNNSSSVKGVLPKGPTNKTPTVRPITTAPAAPAAPIRYTYAGFFRITNSNSYKELLENCRRCGTKRWTQGPYGSINYQRLWTTSGALQRCDNWLHQGFLQIDFQNKTLPSEAKVLIQPKYTGSMTSFSITGEEQEVWGEPFEISVQAYSINKNKGFEIKINPSDGIPGNYSLTLKSNDTNPASSSNLNLNIIYGANQQIISSPQLKEYAERWQSKPKYSCKQYTN